MRALMPRPAARPRRKSFRNGAAMVETALVLPIFVLIVLGIVEFGRAFLVANMLAESARHGARIAILPGSTNSSVVTEVKSRVAELASVNSQFVDVDVTVTPHPQNTGSNGSLSDAQKRDLVTVVVAVPFSKVNVMPIEWLKSTDLKGSCSMRHE